MTTAYWWAAEPNWGDALTPLLIKHFTGIDVTREVVGKADIVAVGSVLEHIPPEWAGTVIGAGRLMATGQLHLHTRTATILAIRGPHSASAVPGDDYAIGDPGLLAPDLVGPIPRIHPLGVLPHWSDRTGGLAGRFAGQHPLVIDPAWDPLRVVKAIGSCQKIVTSSLHGLIVADAFGIPRRFERPLRQEPGGMYKHLDYSASIGAPLLAVGVMGRVSKFAVENRKNELHDAFDVLKGMGS